MSQKIYGIDLDQPITPLMVRDSIIECFFQAHCKDTNLGLEGKEANINKEYCRSIVKKAFEDGGGDFDHPDKSSIMKALDNLAEFAKGFRDPEIIKKHYNEIMTLVEKIV